MKTASVTYQGDLRTQAIHIRSGSSFSTDAPVDNQGKGEAFSPTDLLAVAALTCMITTMGIAARTHELDFGELSGEVTKVMASNPRRVSALEIELRMVGHQLSPKGKKIVEGAALYCPVTQSIHPEIQLTLSFLYE